MSRAGGVVAAGHPSTAEAGAVVLREGGNAVDAAIAAVLASFVCESPLTGLGAGGFMLVDRPGADAVSIDFFCAAPGLDGAEPRSELVPVPVHFDESTTQYFYVGAASCAVPGTPAGLEMAARDFGSMPLGELTREAIRLAREGVVVNGVQSYLFEILAAILTRTPEGEALYAPEGRLLGEGDRFVHPELAEALERFGEEGAEHLYRGDVAEAIGSWVLGRGGVLGPADLEAYRPIERRPVAIGFRGAEVLTNPPPSSGGVLIAFALGLLERLGERSGLERIVAASEAANASRGEEFDRGLHTDGFADRFLAPERLDEVATRIQSGDWIGGGGHGREPGLGSTTHISVVDADGVCASVTCSNGACSGEIVPGTGVHLNNMLGEEDLNPRGFHLHRPGPRVSSMMAPTAVVAGGRVELALGSAGSNRIRSAILQTVLRVVEEGMPADEAVRAPRVHFEDGAVQAEPGSDPAALDRLEVAGVPVVRWPRQNLYFGGCQAVKLDPDTGELSGGGDPRRGGAVAVA